MSTVFRNNPLSINVTDYFDSLHIDRNVNRIVFSNITERHVSLIVSAPLNGFVRISVFPGLSLLCICEPQILREVNTGDTAFKKFMIHSSSDQVEFRIIPNIQHAVCTVFLQISFSHTVPSLQNLAKTIVRANTAQLRHGNLAVEYAKFISHDFNLCENTGENLAKIQLSLETPSGTRNTCKQLRSTCTVHCQLCAEKSHCCTSRNNKPCTGSIDSKITHNPLSFTLFNC